MKPLRTFEAKVNELREPGCLLPHPVERPLPLPDISPPCDRCAMN